MLPKQSSIETREQPHAKPCNDVNPSEFGALVMLLNDDTDEAEISLGLPVALLSASDHLDVEPFRFDKPSPDDIVFKSHQKAPAVKPPVKSVNPPINTKPAKVLKLSSSTKEIKSSQTSINRISAGIGSMEVAPSSPAPGTTDIL